MMPVTFLCCKNVSRQASVSWQRTSVIGTVSSVVRLIADCSLWHDRSYKGSSEVSSHLSGAISRPLRVRVPFNTLMTRVTKAT